MRIGGARPPPVDAKLEQVWREPTGAVWARTIDAGDEVRIEFPDFGVACLRRSTAEIVGYPAAGVDEREFRARIEKEAYPVLYQALGLVSLHASAVSVGDRVIALVGPTHAGKSTLAHAWCQLDPTARLVADDALVFDPADGHRIRELPFVPSLRSETRARFGVAQDAALERVGGSPHSSSRLAGLLLLEPGVEGPCVRPIGAADAVLRLLPDAYCFQLATQPTARRFYESILELVSRVPVRRLVYPYDFAALRVTLDAAVGEVASWG